MSSTIPPPSPSPSSPVCSRWRQAPASTSSHLCTKQSRPCSSSPAGKRGKGIAKSAKAIKIFPSSISREDIRSHLFQPSEQPSVTGTTARKPVRLPPSSKDHGHDLRCPPTAREVSGDADLPLLYFQRSDESRRHGESRRTLVNQAEIRLSRAINSDGTSAPRWHDGPVMDNGAVSGAYAVVNGVNHGSVLAPTLFSLRFTAMPMDVHRDERPGSASPTGRTTTSSIRGECTSSHVYPKRPSMNLSSPRLPPERYLGRGHAKEHGPLRRRLRQPLPGHKHAENGGHLWTSYDTRTTPPDAPFPTSTLNPGRTPEPPLPSSSVASSSAATAPAPTATAPNHNTPTNIKLTIINTSVADSVHTCPHCDRTFTSRIGLVGHL
ncbi:hypothetical protein SprV_0200930300 [Sparganum proliferum]